MEKTIANAEKNKKEKKKRQYLIINLSFLSNKCSDKKVDTSGNPLQ